MWVDIGEFFDREEKRYEKMYGPVDSRTIIGDVRECRYCGDHVPDHAKGEVCPICARRHHECLDCGVSLADDRPRALRCLPCARTWRTIQGNEYKEIRKEGRGLGEAV
jgi:hypothetical protein